MDRLSSLFSLMSPDWRGPERLTDSLVCLCVTDGGGGAEGGSVEGGKDASYRAAPHAGL